MNWEDEGLLFQKFKENAIILDVFTSKYGKVSGIVYGGNSRKIKNYLQIINKVFIIHNSKGENRPGYFKTELMKAISPEYFDNKIKILCINSLSSILKVVLPENQQYKKIYYSLDELLNTLKSKKWLTYYLNWEIELIKNLGFGFNISSKDLNSMGKQKSVVIKLDNVDYKIPSFLFLKDKQDPNSKEIHEALNFLRNLMENKFFIPNNIRFASSRKLLEKKFL